MTATATIHAGRRQLGLDEDTSRDLYARVTGKRSLREMSPDEQERVVQELRRQGFRPASRPARKPLQGKYAGVLQAFWVSGYHLGVIGDRSDEALTAFVRARVHVDHVRFLDAAGFRTVAEALKAWLARQGGVEWPKGTGGRARQEAVIAAQLRILGEPARELGAGEHLPSIMAALGRRVRKVRG